MVFELHWKDGSCNFIEGDNISTAFSCAGYSSGALAALDTYNIAKGVPLDSKNQIYIDKEGRREQLVQGTRFVDEALKQIRLGAKQVNIKIFKNLYSCNVIIEPFAVIYQEV